MERHRSNARKVSLGYAFCVALLVSLALPARIMGQIVGGTLVGTVTDPSGAVIPGVKVAIKNVATGVVTTVTTNSAGLYSAPNLLPGNYQATFTGSGFKTEVRAGITLTVGVQQVLNVTMAVGSVSQIVQVTGAAPTVQLASSTITGQVNATTVRELPLNGRTWTDLATLQPGVTSIHAFASANSPDRIGRGLGNQVSITGARPQDNNYLVNGISINDFANGTPGSVLSTNLGVDAIQEFNVFTTNYSAEYGRTSGGVISAITKSGTNAFHGDAYEFLRNSALDAANFFDNFSNSAIPPFRRNQFGVSAGGPVQKDRTFIFGDYEGVRQFLGVTQIDTVPSAAARSGILSTGNVTVSPLVAPFFAFYPLPNGQIIPPGDTGIFSFAGSENSRENYVVIRLDHTFSSKDSVDGTYTYDGAFFSTPDEFNNKSIFNNSRRQLVTLEETHIFNPSMVSTFRVGVNRVTAAAPAGASAINPLAASTSTSFATVPGDTAGQVNVPGITTFTGGLSTEVPQAWWWTSWQAYENIFLTRGVHSLKFGANVERIQDNSLSYSRPGGVWDFNSLSDFISNQPLDLSADLPGFISPRGLRQTIFGTYLQDDARLRPNLTLNVGLRYEIANVPSEVQGKLSSLPTMTAVQPHLGNPIFANPTLGNVEPRLGFAWDPFHNGKTSIRGGFGVFDVLPLPIELRGAVFAVWPFFDSGSAANLPAGSFPAAAFGLLTPNETTARLDFIEQHPPRNYVMQYNFNIQRSLTPNTTVMLAYVGSRGIHNPMQTDDSNDVLPTATPLGYLWPSPSGSGTRLNPNLGRISATFFASSSYYNSLEVEVTKRLSRSFQAQGSFTWSKVIDSASGTTDGDQMLNGISSLFWWNPNLREGLADFNVGRNLVLNGTWYVPTPHSFTGPAKWALGGWELDGIFTASDGVPFTPIIGGDPLGLNNIDPFDFPNRLVGPGCNSPVNPGSVSNYIKLQCLAFPNPSTLLGNAGRNILIGPGLAEFDFGLMKNTPIPKISETFHIQFRAELFNILNRANFNPPTDNEFVFDQFGNPIPSAGLIDATSAASREIQFALKFIW